MIREAIVVHIESLVAHGDPFPGRLRSSESPSPRVAAAPPLSSSDVDRWQSSQPMTLCAGNLDSLSSRG